jgi:hypothetical protein
MLAISAMQTTPMIIWVHRLTGISPLAGVALMAMCSSVCFALDTILRL